MVFEQLPTIDLMLHLYQKPRTIERFNDYLTTLQGHTNGDLAFPIAGFNPMGKQLVTQKLNELKKLGAEQIIQTVLTQLNKTLIQEPNKEVFKVALNLSDDLEGGWTNRFTSDFDSKFKINALVKRKFCTPIFWTSEVYSEKLIIERTTQCIYRTVYWLNHTKPNTLSDYVSQEKFVAEKTGRISFPENEFYNKNKYSENYHLIFNYFYGDAASASLNFPMFGAKP